MSVGFGPCLLLERKWEGSLVAVIVLTVEDSKELEGVCHGVGHIFSPLTRRCPSVLLAKEQLLVTEL